MPWIPQAVLDHLLALANDARPRREHLNAAPMRVTVGEGSTRPAQPPMRWEDFQMTVGEGSTRPAQPPMRWEDFQKQKNTDAPEVPPVVIELPEAIQSASVAFSYGNPQQITANEEYARRALLRGADPLDIVKALQDGEEL